MCKDVIIIGAGGHGKVIADIICKSGDRIYGFLDSDILKENVIGKIEDCIKYRDKYFIIAIGNNEIRKKIAEKYTFLNYYTAIHPTAVIASDVELGKGSAVMPCAVINANSKIGEHCIINTAAIVEHDNCIDNYVHISPNVTLCGTVKVGTLTHIGAGTVVKNNISICDCVTVGCGGVVIKDIKKSGTFVGMPVREV